MTLCAAAVAAFAAVLPTLFSPVAQAVAKEAFHLEERWTVTCLVTVFSTFRAVVFELAVSSLMSNFCAHGASQITYATAISI
jgi:hypothetical protein